MLVPELDQKQTDSNEKDDELEDQEEEQDEGESNKEQNTEDKEKINVDLPQLTTKEIGNIPTQQLQNVQPTEEIDNGNAQPETNSEDALGENCNIKKYY